ncbi:MAG: hypothetical protein COX06_01110, partial [Candidatus Zambryskibacteria bacterium CG22_combo_CG10-13_8_21_14_all_42_17]
MRSDGKIGGYRDGMISK